MTRAKKKKAPQRTATGTKHKKQAAKKPAKPAIVARGKRKAPIMTTRPSNGSRPSTGTQPAPDAITSAAQALGPMKINDEKAAEQMAELGGLITQVEEARLKYESKAEAAKTARKTYEGIRDHFFARAREFTHPKALPLFDAVEQEQDRQQMLASAEPPPTTLLHEVPKADGVATPPMPDVPKDQIPF